MERCEGHGTYLSVRCAADRRNAADGGEGCGGETTVEGAPAFKAGVSKPGRKRQGPRGKIYAGGRGGCGKDQTWRYDHRGDLGKHGNRSGDHGGRQGLSSDSHDAGDHERGAQKYFKSLRRGDCADGGREGNGRSRGEGGGAGGGNSWKLYCRPV